MTGTSSISACWCPAQLRLLMSLAISLHLQGARDRSYEYSKRRHPGPRHAKVMDASVDFEEHFIEMPAVAVLRRATPQSVSVSLPELKAPFSNRLIAQGDAAHR
jgi:hypothetical protein